jgi:hypothetical protein
MQNILSRKVIQHISIVLGISAMLFAVFSFDPALATVTFSGNVKVQGNLSITGALSKGSGTFVIDHPLDPENKLLYHSFVESPDVKNMYDGVVVLDDTGSARIHLPEYFEALNKDFRYQYAPIAESMPQLFVSQKIKDNSFVISGGVPGGKVSWQVTGIRHDPYIIANPIIVEVPKSPTALKNKGECLYEPLCE